jgi:DNA-binding LacI/PurR family transcriptional regulator
MYNPDMLKYKKFGDSFLQEIRNGKYRTGERLPSERELSRRYNLAHMTVNKALNGLVAMGFLERRQGDGTYIKECALPKTACLILDYKDDIHAPFPHVTQKALFEAGFIVTVFDSHIIAEAPSLLKTYLKSPPELLVFDGWAQFPFNLLKYVPEATRKIIFHRCETKPDFDASYVLADTEKCGYLAVKQLVLSGRRRIGIVSEISESEYDQANLFKRGCEKALSEFKIKNAIFLERKPVRGQEGSIPENDVMEMLQGGNRCDGIMALMDAELIPFIKAANKLEVSIPEQLALIGRFNTPWADHYKLTSTDIQSGAIAENIKTVLNSKENVTIMVDPKIVFRESCPQAGQYLNFDRMAYREPEQLTVAIKNRRLKLKGKGAA